MSGFNTAKEKEIFYQFLIEKKKQEELNKLLTEKIAFETISSSPDSLQRHDQHETRNELDEEMQQLETHLRNSLLQNKPPHSSQLEPKERGPPSTLGPFKNIASQQLKDQETPPQQDDHFQSQPSSPPLSSSQTASFSTTNNSSKSLHSFPTAPQNMLPDISQSHQTQIINENSEKETQNTSNQNSQNENKNEDEKERSKQNELQKDHQWASLFSWGRGGDGQLGHGDLLDATTPRSIEGLRGNSVGQVACGGKHNLVIMARGEVYSFGWNYQGQLGLGDLHDELEPKVIKGLSLAKALQNKNFIAVSAGSEHSLALTDTGEVYSWGGNAHGSLGHGAEKLPSFVPRMILPLHQVFVTQIACGGFHCLALTNNGNIFSWGRGSNGRLGHGHENDINRPTLIPPISFQKKVISVACGWSHCLAILQNGHLVSWGKGEDGMLGHGDQEDRFKPTLVDYLKDERVIQVSAGYYHSAALTTKGAYTFGYGEFGQLGLGKDLAKNRVSKPQLIPNLSSVIKIACGGFHSMIVTTDGQLWGMGLGEHGQLGLGNTQSQFCPVSVPIPGKCVDVACGFWHTVGVFMKESTKSEAHVFHNYQDDWVESVRKQIEHPETGIIRKRRKWYLAVYQNCFTGTEFVDYLVKHQICRERKNGIDIGRFFLAQGIILHVENQRDFEDDQTLYNFSGEDNFTPPIQELAAGPSTFALTPQQSGRSSSFIEAISSWIWPSPNKEVADTLKTKQIEDQWVEILKDWDNQKKLVRTKNLWRQGIPNNIRGRVWLRSCDNALNITPQVFSEVVSKLHENRKQKLLQGGSGESDFARLIDVDIARTWSSTELFSKTGPFYKQLVNVLEIYATFAPNLGYVQGMSYIAAMLSLYLPGPYETFYCLANILHTHFFFSLFKMDINSILQHVRVYDQLFSEHLPSLFQHFQTLGISPEHYLLDWFMTVFAKALPISIASRCWDCFILEGEVFIFRIAVGILKLNKAKLKTSSFESCVKALRNLEIEEKDTDRLFDSILSIKIPQHIINIAKKLENKN